MAKTLTLGRIHKEIVRLDPTLKPGDPSFISATILLGALRAGTAIRPLATFTRLPRRVVAERVHRLKANGVFQRNGKIFADWFGEHGGVALWADVCVAEGLMNRAATKPRKR